VQIAIKQIQLRHDDHDTQVGYPNVTSALRDTRFGKQLSQARVRDNASNLTDGFSNGRVYDTMQMNLNDILQGGNRMRKLLVLFTLLTLCSLGLAQSGRLVVAQGVDATTMDPNDQRETPTANVITNMFDALFRRDVDGGLIPWLATEVTAVDELTWELELREGVTFHNGEPFNAEVAKFNFDRLTDPERPLNTSDLWTSVESTEVTGDYTIRVTTSRPLATFLTQLTQIYMVPKTYIEENGADFFASNPVGTGPFTFVRWNRDQEVVMRANPDYWQGPPTIEELVIRPIPENSSRVAELLTGGVDIITNLAPEAVGVVNNSGIAQAATVPSIRNIFIVLNVTGEGPLNDPLVRTALNYAVDKETIINTILGGDGVAVGCPLNTYMFGYVEDLCEPFPFDPERARELLAEAGYPDGFGFTMGSPDGRYLNDRQVAEAVVGQLAEVGVQAELRVQEWSTYVGQILERQVPTDAWLIGWGNSQFDADNSIYSLLYGGTVEDAPGGVVFSYLFNNDLDVRLLEARATVDQDRRAELYAEALQIIRDEAPWIFLYQQEDIYGVSNRVNWSPRPDELIWAYDVDWD
jgi:peptide/nickel transport system substrate-binding protein